MTIKLINRMGTWFSADIDGRRYEDISESSAWRLQSWIEQQPNRKAYFDGPDTVLEAVEAKPYQLE